MFEIINNTNKEIKELDKLEKYMNFVIEKLELKEAIFNIIFVSNEEIHNINREYRHTDRVTDVISFALEDNPDVVYDSFRLLGDIYIAIDVAYDQAVEYFTQALELSDGWVQNVDYDMNYYLAAAYTKNGQPAEAKKVYDAILGLKPEEKDAYFLRGSAELELGDYESAKADFDQAISMDPKNYDRLIEIYEALAAHGYREVGQEYLQNVLDTAKQLDAYDSGRIYYYLGEYQKAYLALDEARDKGGADSYLYLGRAYAATGDYNYASSVYNNYLSKQGPNAEIYNELGLCEMAKKEYQNALAAFQAGKQIEGNSLMQTLCFNEIVAYEYLEDYQQAEILMNAYLQNYPDDQTAIREQQFLSTR